MACSVGLTPRLTLFLCLGWLLVVSVASPRAGEFQVVEEPAQDPMAAAVRQHLRAQGHLRVWTAVLTELLVLPTDVTVALAPCGRIDAFYSPAQRRIHLCDELLTYFARVFAPPGGRPEATTPAVRNATLYTFFHLVGHALIQVLDLPVTGPGEQAADELGAVFLIAGSTQEEQAVLAGSQTLFQRSRTPEPPREVPFWALHPWTEQRYVHLRCLLYGSNPTRHAALLGGSGLGEEHAQQCPAVWQRRQQHWNTVLAPHLHPQAPATGAPQVPPASVLDAPSPEQLLQAYYGAINQRQYARTWLMLAPQFKQTHFCCEDDGSYQFSRYRVWWESVERVDVLEARIHERQPHAVVVRTALRYAMKSGKVTEETHLFRLVEEPATQRWLIADQTRGVLRHRAP